MYSQRIVETRSLSVTARGGFSLGLSLTIEIPADKQQRYPVRDQPTVVTTQ